MTDQPSGASAPELGVFEQRAEVEKRLAAIRRDAERVLVFPITRDDALWLCDRIQAVIDATIDARVTYGLINPDAEDIAASASPMFTERDAVVRALFAGKHDAD